MGWIILFLSKPAEQQAKGYIKPITLNPPNLKNTHTFTVIKSVETEIKTTIWCL